MFDVHSTTTRNFFSSLQRSFASLPIFPRNFISNSPQQGIISLGIVRAEVAFFSVSWCFGWWKLNFGIIKSWNDEHFSLIEANPTLLHHCHTLSLSLLPPMPKTQQHASEHWQHTTWAVNKMKIFITIILNMICLFIFSSIITHQTWSSSSSVPSLLLLYRLKHISCSLGSVLCGNVIFVSQRGEERRKFT